MRSRSVKKKLLTSASPLSIFSTGRTSAVACNLPIVDAVAAADAEAVARAEAADAALAADVALRRVRHVRGAVPRGAAAAGARTLSHCA